MIAKSNVTVYMNSNNNNFTCFYNPDVILYKKVMYTGILLSNNENNTSLLPTVAMNIPYYKPRTDTLIII